MENPLKAPDSYRYERLKTPFGAAVIATNEAGVLLGIANIREVNVPLVPQGIKSAIREVRMRRAEVRAAHHANRTKERWDRTWRMTA